MNWLKQSPLRERIRALRNNLLDGYYWSRAKAAFLRLNGQVTAPQDAVDLLWAYSGGGHYRTLLPNQDKGEIRRLLQTVQDLQPKVIVEIGTRDGGSLYLWSRAGAQLEALISIDLPGGIHGGGYPAAREKFYQLFVSDHPQATLHLMRADSQQQATVDQLKRMLKGRPIDFLFIDGDHRYEGVRRDYELYRDLVRPGGLIAFHDIRPNIYDDTIQVYQLWDQICESGLQTREIIHEPYTGRYGIGLVTQA